MQGGHKKLKSGLVTSYNIRPGSKRGPILVLALHKFLTHLLRHLPTYIQPGTHTGLKNRKAQESLEQDTSITCVYNFNEAGGHGKPRTLTFGNISEMVQDRDLGTTDH